ncbi:MAG: Fur family transcriptional regulator [Candidatus Cloacimonetes bacterium]|jgi:Fur family ferric uptake transcriptional regulator|nr:transcriptional repressor [Candidatus Cloacimonadota bacterium]MDD4155156.1 Fur family transcriptional regulator [Candidatus Cloacimonadota bacterium]
MKDYNSVFEEYLQVNNLKFTEQRKIILNAVFNNHNHFCVDTLFEQIQSNDSFQEYVSRATIYRTIPLLLEANLIKVSEKLSDKETYEHCYGHPKHAHLMCTICNRIIEEDEDRLMNKVINQIAKKNKFKITDFNICIKGECCDCQSKK